MDTKTLLHLAEAYCAHTNLKLSTVSTYASGDGKKFKYWQHAGGCTLKTAARVLAWFDENWPADLTWPKHIARPSATSKLPRGRRAA